jgi:hypothetical protein
MRNISLIWLLLALLAILALAASPAAGLATGSGGGVHLACGGSSGGCQGR